MTPQAAANGSLLLSPLGDFRWVRAHVSFYAVGVVLLAAANLLLGGPRLWSLTAIGIWSMLLVVHLILLAIARLSAELLADDDDEEIVILPVQDAVIVEPRIDPTATWTAVQTADVMNETSAENDEPVSWQIATDAAQARRQTNQKPEAETT